MNRVPGNPIYQPSNLLGMLPELARVDELARLLERMETPGLIGERGTAGLSLAPQQRPGWWAIITEQSTGPDGTYPNNPPKYFYSWAEIIAGTIDASGDRAVQQPDTTAGGSWTLGDNADKSTNLPAVEINHNEHVPADVVTGAIVWVELSASGDCVYFSYTTAGLTVEEVDGSPSGFASTIAFDSTTGVSVHDVTADVATVKLLAASVTQMGAVTTAAQNFKGTKGFLDDLIVYGSNPDPTVGDFHVRTAAFGWYAFRDLVGLDGGGLLVTTDAGNSIVQLTLVAPGGVAPSTATYRINNGGSIYTGQSATDAIGNVFKGGIITTVQTSASTARTNLGLAIGTNVEAWDADLDAIAALSGTGVAARTGTNAWTLYTFDTDGTLAGNSDTAVASQKAVKAYVDALAQGISWKQPVVVATTANITLSGEQTIDGVLTSASRVLVKDQSTGSQNGIYVSAAGAWTRATDADTGSELVSAAVLVEKGTVSADKAFICTNDSITIGSTAITWVSFGNALGSVTSVNLTAPAAGITVSGGPITTSGSITLALANDLLGVEGLSGTGLAARTATDTWTTRSVVGTTNQVALTNGDGVSGNPTVSLAGPHAFTTQTSHGILLGAGTSAVAAMAVGTDGQLVVGQSAADPLWKTLSGSGATIALSAAGVLTISGIANASLSNSSVTVTAGTGLSGGGAVALGSAVTLSLATTIPQAETIQVSDAGTTNVPTVLTVDHASSSAAANGFGSVTLWTLKDSTTAAQSAMDLTVTWVNATHATRQSKVVLNVYDSSGAYSVLNAGSSGGSPTIGFLGSVGVGVQSGDVISALANFGLLNGGNTYSTGNLTGTLAAGQFPALTGDVTTSAGALATTIGAHKVTRGMQAQGAGLSVIGVTGGSTADVADITAGTDFHVLRRASSSSMGFGLIDMRSQNIIGASVYPSANYVLNNATYTALGFNTELFDTNALHDTVTNNSRITVPSGMAGKWFLLAIIGGFLSTGAGQAIAEFGPAKNGSLVADLSCAASAVVMACDVTSAVATDYFELIAKQNSGANQTMLTSGSLYPRLVAVYLGA